VDTTDHTASRDIRQHRMSISLRDLARVPNMLFVKPPYSAHRFGSD